MLRENIISVSVDSKTSSGNGKLTLQAGKVIGVLAYSSSPNNNHNNDAMVRTQILVNGREVAQLQPIDNLRSRNVKFIEDGKPIENVGGNTVEVKVLADATFNADTSFDFVFVYEDTNC